MAWSSSKMVWIVNQEFFCDFWQYSLARVCSLSGTTRSHLIIEMVSNFLAKKMVCGLIIDLMLH